MQTRDKTFVVTGGGNGIGRELVLALLRRGATVAAVDVQPAALDETLELAGPLAERLSTHVTNIADAAAVDALARDVIARHGAVDGVINNAGIIQPFVNVSELPMDTIRRVLDVNLYGVLHVTKAFLPHLLTRPEAHVVNLSSMGGFFPFPGQSVYGASKAAVKLLTEGLHAELADTRVRVTVVFPGAIGTQIAQNSGVALTGKMQAAQGKVKLTTPAAAAEAILRGVERDRLRVFVGADSKAMDLLYRLHPGFATALVRRLMKRFSDEG